MDQSDNPNSPLSMGKSEIKQLDFRQVNLLRDLTLSQCKHLMISHHGKSGSIFFQAHNFWTSVSFAQGTFFSNRLDSNYIRFAFCRWDWGRISSVHDMLDAQPIVVAPVQPFLADRDTELQGWFLEICDCWLFSKNTTACLIASLRDDWYHHCLQFFIIIIIVVDHD